MMLSSKHCSTIYFMAIHIFSKRKLEYQLKNTHFMKMITSGDGRGFGKGIERIPTTPTIVLVFHTHIIQQTQTL